MATRYFCDGCDGEIGEARSVVVRIVSVTDRLVEMKAEEQDRPLGDKYDLCQHCEHRLRQQANPTTWPRLARERPSRPAA